MTGPPDDALGLDTTVSEAGGARIRIVGDLDRDTADQLTEAALACLGTDPAPRRLRLDCAGLTWCDSLGLAALLMVHRTAVEAGVLLRLENQPAALRRLLATTGTARVFAGAAAGEDTTGARANGGPERAAGAPVPLPSPRA
ncbi:STAS domain-containing protein [Streptomyces sp. NPDC018031]|uniref:STAS domain-containing protein n=1 Tax=Streptomyces sp. NPDC018031 TaxID=3365033 RepID=UPI0037B16901